LKAREAEGRKKEPRIRSGSPGKKHAERKRGHISQLRNIPYRKEEASSKIRGKKGETKKKGLVATTRESK